MRAVLIQISILVSQEIFACCFALEKDEKRILLNDQDFVNNQQLQRDVQILKATVEQLKQSLDSQNRLVQAQSARLDTQDKTIQAQSTTVTDLQTKISGLQGAVYTQWGRKTCTHNGTELVYSGISGGGRYSEPGRSATPVCVPHDPDIGPVGGTSYFGTLYGMEYYDDTNVFGSGLHDKDVPCAVCRVITATSVLMIPGKKNCHSGWSLEYRGLLSTGYWNDAGASSYICLDQSPDVLEGGVKNEEGYNIFPVKAYCGSLKCPPYVQNSLVYCSVCSK